MPQQPIPLTFMTALRGACLAVATLLVPSTQSWAAPTAAITAPVYRIGVGDSLRIAVYQNADLTLEIRVNDDGESSFPLIGKIRLGGLTVNEAETAMATALRNGGFVKNPQVMITVVNVRANFVNVLGNIARPGRYPLDVAGMQVTEVIALAGGLAANANERILLVGKRNGTMRRIEIDLPSLFGPQGAALNEVVQPGDSVWVDRAPVAYLYGEVQRPGQVQIARDLTLMQAIVTSGGITPRGTLKGVKVTRRDAATGKVVTLEPSLEEKLQDGDVIQIRESLF